MRSELSKKNPYWLPKHRFLELQHFCLQYPEWIKEAVSTNSLTAPQLLICAPLNHPLADPTGAVAVKLAKLNSKINLIRNCAKTADQDLAVYIVTGVTRGWSYNVLKRKMDIPCSIDTYYDRYRKFFYILNEARD